MPQSTVENVGEKVAQTVREASRVTSAAANAVEEGLGAAQRAAKRGGDAAEQFVAETTQRIQRNPVVTVAVAAAAGFAAGVLTALIARRK